ncbi:MAG: hypothetical protein PHW66_09495 [Gallionella sp.]|nr:hypothetical protein [Gallionella sp.]
MSRYYQEDCAPHNAREFANTGSALRRATRDNPRNLPCPTCGAPDRLTYADKMRGYQCDECANAAEWGAS